MKRKETESVRVSAFYLRRERWAAPLELYAEVDGAWKLLYSMPVIPDRLSWLTKLRGIRSRPEVPPPCISKTT